MEGDSDLDFRFRDHEIKTARTTSGIGYKDRRPATAGITADLILEGPSSEPIVGEVKAANDTDPFYGLIQALAAAAELAPAGQRRRLAQESRRWSPERPALSEDAPLRVYVFWETRSEKRETYWQELHDAALEIVEGVNALPDKTRPVGRLALISVRRIGEGELALIADRGENPTD